VWGATWRNQALSQATTHRMLRLNSQRNAPSSRPTPTKVRPKPTILPPGAPLIRGFRRSGIVDRNTSRLQKDERIANSCPPYIILLRFLITSKGEDKTMMKRGSVVSMLSFALLLSAISLQAQSKDAVEKALQGKEQAGWQAWKDKNPKAFDDILPENSINIAGGSMDNGKSNIIKGMTTANCEVASFSLSDFSYMWLDKDTVLMTYKASQDGSCGGTKIAPKVIASSIWQKQGGKWVSPFHQETVTSSM
jgi:hypothetical protein